MNAPRIPRSARLFLALGGIGILSHCAPPEPENEKAKSPPSESSDPILLTFQEGHMGTQFTIRTWAAPEEQEAAREAISAAFSRISDLEQVFSDYLVDSEIAKLTAIPAGQAVPISADLFQVLSRACA